MNQAIPLEHDMPICDRASAIALVKQARTLLAGVRLDVQGADARGQLILDGGEKCWGLPAQGALRQGRPASRKSTAQQYLAACARVVARGLEPEELVAMARTKRTFYFYRAALVWLSARDALRLIRRADKLAREEGYGPRYYEVINDLREYVRTLKVFKPDPDGMRRQQGQAQATPGAWTRAQQQLQGQRLMGEKAVPMGALKQTGKRRGLSLLPDTWQAQFWTWVKDSKYADVVAVLDCCGCRPSELELGVAVSWREGCLELLIQGTKRHGGKYGQAWRRVRVEPTFAAAQHLVALCRGSETASVNIRVESGKNLSATMAWYSKALWPDQGYVVTPYSFRHQFRAEAVDKLSTDEVAQAMGHSVDRTQNHYGTARQARGRQGGLSVEAARVPKHTRGVGPWVESGYGRPGGPGT